MLDPINEPSTLTYGEASTEIASVQAHQFNLDLVEDGTADSPLVVRAAGREVRLLPAPNYQVARFLLASGAIRYAPLTTINFTVWESATEPDLLRLATGVAGLCGIAIQGQVNLSHALFCDKDGQPVKVMFCPMIRTKYRARHLLLGLHGDPHGLPQLFSECYEEYERLRQRVEWSSSFQMAISCDEGLFVEHRAAALYAALEKLFRNCLVEHGGMTREQAEELLLPKLVGAVRHRLSWPIPGHYTRGNRHLDIRNSVAHGNSFPYSIRAVIDNYEMWKLFLFRRILIRLGYSGLVRCFSRGYSSFSAVDDFSEDQNYLGLEYRQEDLPS